MSNTWKNKLTRIYRAGYEHGKEGIDRDPAYSKAFQKALNRINADEILMQQALDALEFEHGGEPLSGLTAKTIVALRERLREQE